MHTTDPIRDSIRSDVQRALAPRERVCPACGHRQLGLLTCESCGSDMVARRSAKMNRRVVAIVVAGLAVLALLTAVLTSDMRRSAATLRHEAVVRQDRLEAAERARLRAEAVPHFAQGPQRRDGQDPLAYRERLVATAEGLITTDARRRVEAGTLAGPVAGTACEPYPATDARRELERDRAVPRGRYECLAFSRRFPLTELEGRKRTGVTGWPYWLVVDYGTGKLTFCKITPRAGEGGRSLAWVPVPEPCRDPLR